MSDTTDNAIDGLFVDYDDDSNEVEVLDFSSPTEGTEQGLEAYRTGEEMNLTQAQEITNTIRAAGVAVYVLISKAHEGKAYKALGYSNFEDYVKQEFDLTRSRAYQLLDLSKTIKAIEDATPEGTEIKLTEAQARDLKRELPKITERIHEETESLDANEASEVATTIIEEERQKVKDEKEAAKDNANSFDNDSTPNHSDTPFESYGEDNTPQDPGHDGYGPGGQDDTGSTMSPNNNAGGGNFDEDGVNTHVNNVDAALEPGKSTDDEDMTYTGEQHRSPLMKEDDIIFFLDFVERVENFPKVHNLLNSLTPAQRKIISRKAMPAADYLNELMDELAISEMSR